MEVILNIEDRNVKMVVGHFLARNEHFIFKPFIR